MLQLYPHNQTAYDNAKFIFETENKTCIVHATGTGKSLIVANFILENPKAKFLFLAPTTFIFHEIKKHIKGHVHNVDFQTYQYFIFNSTNTYVNYDFVFLDEFHRVGAKEWNTKIVEIIEQNSNAKILGTTATHIRFLDDERNMAEELFDNNICSYLSLGEAIEKNILPKPKYISSLYNIKDILDDAENKLKKQKRNKDVETLRSKRVIWEQSNGIDYIIKKHFTPKRNKILVFCKNIEHTVFVQELIKPILGDFFKNNNQTVEFNLLYSKLNSKQIKKIYHNFEHSTNPQVLFSVDMLNEGIHVKGVDTVMLFRDTVSPIIYFQQMGRGFEAGQKQETLIFDFVNNFNIKTSSINIQNNFYNNFNETNSEHYYKDRNLVVDFFDESLDFQNFICEFNLNYKTWNESLQELKDWIASNNRMPINKESTWLASQKYRFKKNQLTEEQINLLLEIDENILDDKFKTWNESLQELKDWIASNNRTPMSRESAWLASQKINFKKNKLTEEQINLLLEIDENIFDDKFKTWNESLQELKDWIASNNRMPTNKESAWLASQKNGLKIIN